MQQLARWCYRRRRVVVVAWVVALVAIGVLTSLAGNAFVNNFSVPGVQSQRAFDLLRNRFSAFSGEQIAVVFRAERGVDDPGVRSKMEQVFTDLGRVPHVVAVLDPYAVRQGSISADATIGLARVQLDAVGPAVPKWVVKKVIERAERARAPGLEVELGGAVVQFAQGQGPGGREGIGVLAAVVILLITFGSGVAMGIPVVTALFGLGVGIPVVGLLAHLVDIFTFAPPMATMIGLGVGIDYALFIITRYRQGIHAGLDPEEATATAVDTSGRAVVFAGATVVVSLLGMMLMRLSFAQGLAFAASTVVVLTVIAAITLLPAMLGFAGQRIDALRVPNLHRRERAPRETAWHRWSRLVQRRPWLFLSAALVVLVTLALPLFSMRLGGFQADAGPKSSTARRAYDLVAHGFGPGSNGPLLLVARVEKPADLVSLQRMADWVGQLRGVVATSPVLPSPAGDAAIVTVVPASGPQDQQTERLVHDIRREAIRQGTAGTGTTVLVGGVTALFIDMGERVTQRLPLFIAGVIAVSFLLLVVVFRSVVLPLKAAVMNLLSIGAAYGIVVAVFQWGWASRLVGVDRAGPIMAFMPMMLFAILFGLSMDYEVFLLSRVREEYQRSGDNSVAVADGLAATARVITAAAAIMVTVFLSFVLGDDPIIKQFGLGLAAAVLVDATIIRLVLVPAVMELLGPANWWFPNWLDRIVPRISTEAPPDLEPAPVPTPPLPRRQRPLVAAGRERKS